MTDGVRAAELVAAVSAAGDFAKGLPEEQAQRTCAIALALCDALGLDGEQRRAVFYIALLRYVGCTATASDMAADAALGSEQMQEFPLKRSDRHGPTTPVARGVRPR